MDKEFSKSFTKGLGFGTGATIAYETCKSGAEFFEKTFNTIVEAAKVINSIANNLKGKDDDDE